MAISARRLARLVLRLYPSHWRERYEVEVAALLERHQVTHRTLLDLLLGALDARLGPDELADPTYRADTHYADRRLMLATKREILVGLAPFLALGTTILLLDLLRLISPLIWSEVPYLVGVAVLILIVGALLLPLLALGIGWARGFPRWAYPYLGQVVLLSLAFQAQPTPTLAIFGITLAGSPSGRPDLLGWRAWLPVLALAVAVLLVTRSLRSLRSLASGVWRDWTRLSFAIYGLMPLTLWASLDEVRPEFRLPCLLAIYLALTAGALAYLRSRETWRRALALAAGAAVAAILGHAGGEFYWRGRLAMPTSDYLNGIVLVLLLAPALLGLVRHVLAGLGRPAVSGTSAG